MSRSIGARAVFQPPKAFREMLQALGERIEDPTPVNQRIAFDARDEVLERLSAADFTPPLAETTIERWGEHPPGNLTGGFAPTIRPFWDKRGAGWLTRAPHAHFFDSGTHEYHNEAGGRVHVFGSGRRHVSRPESKRRLARSTSTIHEPERPFAFLSQQLIDRSCDRVVGFVLTGEVGA